MLQISFSEMEWDSLSAKLDKMESNSSPSIFPVSIFSFSNRMYIPSEQNRYFLMRDKDWEKIFADIEDNKESFGRYYPLFRVRIESDGLMDMSIALLINDDLYAYSKELAEQEEE